ncbi:hypothetical protein BU26DRAFT_230716 [Trematosphaeria pertusa]|uniref:Uncharacterized protein n=1 Tax=Trematosphaeria pertusa TaxID=390896 RepID=A0A6A6ITW5_9PLEO|nr:uncharacterized protein BU26DRAFT_230716 [Trematosphaeria pertusa]KAF2253846.1 hypothetical protein BU26DRAFT_230716 [Trematosphaeria pertusa]
MTEHDPAVRNSTLNALRLSCPSAEVLDPPSDPSPSPMENPFIDADAEWSDEEVLIPKNRRKMHYVPPTVTVTASLSTAESTSSGSNSPSPNRLSVNGSPLIPPKSPSRPDIRPGSSQEDLVQRFYQVTRERDALRKELQRKSMGPHGIPARASVVYKSDEKTLIEELQALRYEIRLWTEEYFSGPPSSRSKRPHVHRAKELFGSLTDNYNVYLKHNRDRPLLIQAYIWSKLQQRIFSTLNKGCGYVWAGKLGDRKLRPLNDTLRKAVRNEEQAEEYHHWRAMTVNLLVPQVDGKWCPTFDAAPVLKRISRFCSRLRRKLRPWSTSSLRLGKEQLYTIVSAAVALDLKMKRQRADYRFVTFTGGKPDQFWGYGFYDSEMEDIDEEEEGKARRVELSLAPALERCGNANGHVFDQNFILVKADVSCKRLDRKRAGGRPGRRHGIRSVMNIWHR